MSIREVQDIIHRLGLFIFRGGTVNEGMLVARYNIRKAKIEYYFIHTSRLIAYRQARKESDRNAHTIHGNIIDINTIIRAQLFN